MRIWLVNEYANPPSVPGGGRHQMLAHELVQSGHEVVIIRSSFDHLLDSVLGDGRWRSSEFHDGVEYVVLKTPSYHTMIGRVLHMLVFMLRVAVLRLHGSEPPDVVVGSTPHSFQVLGARLLARRFGVPFILEIRDIWPLSITELSATHRYHPFITVVGMIEKSVARAADRIVILSPKVGEYLEELLGRPVSVVWIPNGVDVSSRVTNNVGRDGPCVVMYAGAMGPPNALDILVRATSEVRQRGLTSQDVEFRFVGAGSSKVEMEELAERLGVDGITFEEPIARRDVPALLDEASILVVAVRRSRLYRYGISLNKLAEYMSSGRPVVLSADIDGTAVEESRCGIVVAAEDPSEIALAVIELCGMSDFQRHEIGARGTEYVRDNLSSSILGRRLLDLVLDVVADRGRA